MGASGSGKSTLLNILGILDDYDSGEYWLGDTLIRSLSERKAASYRNRFIGSMFQSFNPLPFKTALENVALPLYYQGVSRRRRNQIATQYLERVGLRELLPLVPAKLPRSGFSGRASPPTTASADRVDRVARIRVRSGQRRCDSSSRRRGSRSRRGRSRA